MLGSSQNQAVQELSLKQRSGVVSILTGGSSGSSANLVATGSQYRVTSADAHYVGFGTDTRPDNTAFAPRIVAY